MNTLDVANQLLKQIEQAINDTALNTNALEDARNGLIDVIGDLKAHYANEEEAAAPVNNDFAEHNVWNFAQTGVRA